MKIRPLFKEAFLIIFLSILLGLVYNTTSQKGIPLIREKIKKITTLDALLFSNPERDTVLPDVPVIAPLHEQALRNSDSIERNYKKADKKSINIVNIEQVKKILNEKRALIIDARDIESYRHGHISGAINVPGLNVDQYFEEFVELPRDTLILLYCNNPTCHLSRLVGDFLQTLGFTRLYHFDGGFDEWMDKKMPYVTEDSN